MWVRVLHILGTRVLHALLMAWILPVTAIAIIGTIEVLAKDPVDHTPDWAMPYLQRQSRSGWRKQQGSGNSQLPEPAQRA